MTDGEKDRCAIGSVETEICPICVVIGQESTEDGRLQVVIKVAIRNRRLQSLAVGLTPASAPIPILPYNHPHRPPLPFLLSASIPDTPTQCQPPPQSVQYIHIHSFLPSPSRTPAPSRGNTDRVFYRFTPSTNLAMKSRPLVSSGSVSTAKSAWMFFAPFICVPTT